MTRATVTGAYGLVGANLVRALLGQGVEVRVADVRRTDALDGLDVEHVEADVLDPKALAAAFDGADVVFHLAAIISIAGDPTGKVWEVNVDGPRNAGTAAREAGVERFVHCSSVHAFDLHTCGPSLDEDGPRTLGTHAPVYDRSKFAGEQALREAADDELDLVIVNPTGVIGIHDHAPSRIGETILQLRDNKIPVNVGGGFDFVDVRDLADGMLSAWKQGRTGENYLLSGTRISIKELGQIVSALTGSTVPPNRLAAVADHAAGSAGDEADPGRHDSDLHARLAPRAPLLPVGQPLQGGHRAGLPGTSDPRDGGRHPRLVRRTWPLRNEASPVHAGPRWSRRAGVA
jgi:dihydroflavonol-4-reductase